MPENNEESVSEKTRTRSPNYPTVTLEEAIKRVKTVYDKEHTHKTAPEVVAKAMGYAGLNGASRSMTSALKKYGLLQVDGNGLKVTEDAMAILELSADDPRSRNARRKAAFKPALFSEFQKTYGDQLPSDESLRFTLLNTGFNKRTAGEVIQIYKSTAAFVGGAGSVDIEAEQKGDEQSSSVQGQVSNSQQGREITSPPKVSSPQTPLDSAPIAPMAPAAALGVGGASTETLSFRTSANSWARVLFDGSITRESIEKLILHLKLSLDDYPSQRDIDIQQSSVTVSLEPPTFASSELPASQINQLLKVKSSDYSQTGPALWRASDADHEVEIVGYAGERNGIHYLYTASGTGLPVSEVEFFDDED